MDRITEPDMAAHLPATRPGLRVGLLGGSFDPAHAGHLAISRTALVRLRLDQLWWLVSPGNPLKPRPPAPLAQRLEGARAQAADPRIRVIAPEAHWGTRATVDTLAALRREAPGVRFVWIMGSDNLAQFHRWQSWREVAALMPIAVVARPGARARALLSPAARALRPARMPARDAPLLPFAAPPAWVFLTAPLSDLSSTALRGG